MAQAEKAQAQGNPEEELSQKCSSLVECISMLRASKAVSDAEARTCNLWRTRCVAIQSQRDAAVEVACSVAAAQGVEEAHQRIRDYFDGE